MDAKTLFFPEPRQNFNWQNVGSLEPSLKLGETESSVSGVRSININNAGKKY